MKNFIDKCILELATPKQINDYCDQWRRSGSQMALHVFLGFSKEEYIEYVTQVYTVDEIVNKRKGNIPEKTFISQCIEGNSQPEEINNFINKWHNGESQSSLSEYLGMNLVEFKRFVELRSSVYDIVSNRMKKL
jgi:hypothetical protein